MQNYEDLDTDQLDRAERILEVFNLLADLAPDLDILARINKLEVEKIHFEGLLLPNDRVIGAIEIQVARAVLSLITQQINWLQQNLQA